MIYKEVTEIPISPQKFVYILKYIECVCYKIVFECFIVREYNIEVTTSLHVTASTQTSFLSTGCNYTTDIFGPVTLTGAQSSNKKFPRISILSQLSDGAPSVHHLFEICSYYLMPCCFWVASLFFLSGVQKEFF